MGTVSKTLFIAITININWDDTPRPRNSSIDRRHFCIDEEKVITFHQIIISNIVRSLVLTFRARVAKLSTCHLSIGRGQEESSLTQGSPVVPETKFYPPYTFTTLILQSDISVGTGMGHK